VTKNLLSDFANNDKYDFRVVAGILRLSTKYIIDSLRTKAIAHLSVAWPSTLKAWDAREDLARAHEMESGWTSYLYPSPIVRCYRSPLSFPKKKLSLYNRRSSIWHEKLTNHLCSPLPFTISRAILSVKSSNQPKMIDYTHHHPLKASRLLICKNSLWERKLLRITLQPSFAHSVP
jgi:hypothetical protein